MIKVQDLAKIKVCHIVTGLNKGGAEVFLLQLCKSINQIYPGYCSVIGLSPYNELAESFKKNNIETTILGMTKSPISFIQHLFSTIKYCKKNQITVIHAHMAHALLFASAVKIFIPGMKIVFTGHSVKLSSKKTEFLVSLVKSFRARDIIFSVNSKMNFNCHRLSVVPNGIDFSSFIQTNPIKNEIFTFIAVGRLEAMKNHFMLIESFNQLKNIEKVQLIILGDGSLKEHLKTSIVNNNLEKKVFLLGKKENIADYLNQSHCFLLPSEWEGFPISLLEAGAASLPCIVTPIQAVMDNFSDESLYISPLKTFIETMDCVVDNYALALEKAKLLHNEVIGNFSIQQVAQTHLQIYQSVLEQ